MRLAVGLSSTLRVSSLRRKIQSTETLAASNGALAPEEQRSVTARETLLLSFPTNR